MSCSITPKDQKLSREYRSLLTNIRPLIEQLDKSKDAQLCLLWLSKLDQCARYEQCERNEILSELSRQVRNKCLEPPFNSQPPPGALRSIQLKKSIPLWRGNDFSDDISSNLTTERSPQSPCSSSSSRSKCRPRSAPWMGKYLNESSNSFYTMTNSKEPPRCHVFNQKYHERLNNDQLIINRYQEIIKSLISQKDKNTESVKMKSVRTYQRKIQELTSNIQILEEENTNLKRKVSDNSASGEKIQELASKNAELMEKVRHLEVTNNILELKCQELEREKDLVVAELSSQLNESEKKLKENDNHLKAMEKKYDENFWACKSEHQAEISELEKKYTSELSTLERILEDKQNEVSGLREQVSTQCLHFEAEVLRLKHDLLQNPELEKEKRKVKFLRSKINILEKGQENMAMLFQTQLEQIISKKDLIISTLEMKIKSKEAENNETRFGSQLDIIISEKIGILERQYRELLEESERQAAERRQIDLQKILVLEKQLLDHGVGVQDISSISYEENLMLTGPEQIIEPISCTEGK